MAEGKAQAADISTIACNSSMGDTACNATSTLQNAVQTIPGWVPLIIITVVGAGLLSLVKLFK